LPEAACGHDETCSAARFARAGAEVVIEGIYGRARSVVFRADGDGTDALPIGRPKITSAFGEGDTAEPGGMGA